MSNTNPSTTHQEQELGKQILLIFPWNFIRGDTGTHSRVVSLVQIMRKLGYTVDQLSIDTNWDGFEALNKKMQLINEVRVYNANAGYKEDSPSAQLYREVQASRSKGFLPDWTTPGMRCMLEEMLELHTYSAICVFYAYYLPLVEDLPIQSKVIYFMEDSCAFQSHYSGNPAPLEVLFDEECARLKLANEIFCISNDEKLEYEKRLGKKLHFLPHLMQENITQPTADVKKRKWDAFFVGFNNPYNVEAMQWYLKEVAPRLPKSFKTVIVGKVTTELGRIPANVETISFAEDLEDIYKNGKICICPMLRGTGMKIKIVEAMAYGIPVVCTGKGVDGLPDKARSGCLVTDNPDDFARYLIKLVKDPAYYDRCRKQIQSYYREVFSREKYVSLMREILADTLPPVPLPENRQKQMLRVWSRQINSHIAVLSQSQVHFYRDLASYHKSIAKPVIFFKRLIRKAVRFLIEPIVDEINQERAVTVSALSILHQSMLQQETSVPIAMLKELEQLKQENLRLWEEVRTLNSDAAGHAVYPASERKE